MSEPQQDQSEDDEQFRVVSAIEVTDRSIAHHNSETRRLWALRASLAARLEQLGLRPPPAPQRDTPGLSGPAPSAPELDEHIDRTAPAPIERPRPDQRIGHQLIERMAAAGIAAPAETADEVPRGSDGSPITQVAPRPIELLAMNVQIDGSRRYEPVLIRTMDLPVEPYEVWVHDGAITEAHLYRRGNTVPLMVCGFQVLGREGWWRPEPQDFSAQFELCRACALDIPGARMAQL
jgi:hypothetical protein